MANEMFDFIASTYGDDFLAQIGLEHANQPTKKSSWADGNEETHVANGKSYTSASAAQSDALKMAQQRAKANTNLTLFKYQANINGGYYEFQFKCSEGLVTFARRVKL